MSGTVSISELHACEVEFAYLGRPVFLGPLCLTIRAGESWALLGKNGSGKSTLLRLLAGLLTPAAGHVRVDATSLADMPLRQRARTVAWLGQNPPVDLELSAGELVLLGCHPRQTSGLLDTAAHVADAEAALARLGVAELRDRWMDHLSGGEAQRVHLAGTLVQAAPIILLDEPTTSLDVVHQIEVCRVLAQIAGEGNVIVVTTHDVNLAARHFSHAALLDKGQVLASGRVRDVLTTDNLARALGVRMGVAQVGQADGEWFVPLDRV